MKQQHHHSATAAESMSHAGEDEEDEDDLSAYEEAMSDFQSIYNANIMGPAIDEYLCNDTDGDSDDSGVSGMERRREFHLCGLCGHCLVEPLTLVCGCTYCRACLLEHSVTVKCVAAAAAAQVNKKQQRKIQVSRLNLESYAKFSTKRKHSLSFTRTDNSEDEQSLDERQSATINAAASSSEAMINVAELANKCFNCSRTHPQNSSELVKQNVIVSKLVDKFWWHNIEVRKLRNDVRRFICLALDTCSNTSTLSPRTVLKLDQMLKLSYDLGKYFKKKKKLIKGS
jgi:hypothetical protein